MSEKEKKGASEVKMTEQMKKKLREIEEVLSRPKQYGARPWEVREVEFFGRTRWQCGYVRDGAWYGVSALSLRREKAESFRKMMLRLEYVKGYRPLPV